MCLHNTSQRCKSDVTTLLKPVPYSDDFAKLMTFTTAPSFVRLDYVGPRTYFAPTVLARETSDPNSGQRGPKGPLVGN